MPLLSKPAFGPRTALIYITVGALLDVVDRRSGTSGLPATRRAYISRNTWFWLTGLFLTGLILMLIGFYLGRIGRAARKAEVPPSDVQHDEAAIQQTAAATPHPVVTGRRLLASAVPTTAHNNAGQLRWFQLQQPRPQSHSTCRE